MAKVGFPPAAERCHRNTLPERLSCLSVGGATWPATAAAPSRFCSHWPSRTAGTSPPTASCWGSCLLSSAPTLTKLYVTFCRPQVDSTRGRVTAGVRCTSFSCVSGVQQQLSFGCADKVAAGKHSQAGAGAHAGIADSCRASRGSDTSGGSGDDGPSGRTQVSCFC